MMLTRANLGRLKKRTGVFGSELGSKTFMRTCWWLQMFEHVERRGYMVMQVASEAWVAAFYLRSTEGF